jgi:hypothetical protein
MPFSHSSKLCREEDLVAYSRIFLTLIPVPLPPYLSSHQGWGGGRGILRGKYMKISTANRVANPSSKKIPKKLRILYKKSPTIPQKLQFSR